MTPDQPTVLALPAPESGATANNKMDLSENTVHTVKLDELGPMVVNSDGVRALLTSACCSTLLTRCAFFDCSI